MEQLIRRRLLEIEKTEHVRILFAAESGSRAWGFPSPDSDYDVRFVYVRPETAYLKLEGIRDVIECPIQDALDINGWDLQKTLRLLFRSNPTVFEWASSPLVYLETGSAERFRGLMPEYFSPGKSLYHYLSMAEQNQSAYLQGDLVRAKKYFYVLRPVLACRWILERNTPPPMLFSELAAEMLPASLKDPVDGLLALKTRSPEVREIPRIDALHAFLGEELPRIRAAASRTQTHREQDWSRLNAFFLDVLGRTDL